MGVASYRILSLDGGCIRGLVTVEVAIFFLFPTRLSYIIYNHCKIPLIHGACVHVKWHAACQPISCTSQNMKATSMEEFWLTTYLAKEGLTAIQDHYHRNGEKLPISKGGDTKSHVCPQYTLALRLK